MIIIIPTKELLKVINQNLLNSWINNREVFNRRLFSHDLSDEE